MLAELERLREIVNNFSAERESLLARTRSSWPATSIACARRRPAPTPSCTPRGEARVAATCPRGQPTALAGRADAPARPRHRGGHPRVGRRGRAARRPGERPGHRRRRDRSQPPARGAGAPHRRAARARDAGAATRRGDPARAPSRTCAWSRTSIACASRSSAAGRSSRTVCSSSSASATSCASSRWTTPSCKASTTRKSSGCARARRRAGAAGAAIAGRQLGAADRAREGHGPARPAASSRAAPPPTSSADATASWPTPPAPSASCGARSKTTRPRGPAARRAGGAPGAHPAPRGDRAEPAGAPARPAAQDHRARGRVGRVAAPARGRCRANRSTCAAACAASGRTWRRSPGAKQGAEVELFRLRRELEAKHQAIDQLQQIVSLGGQPHGPGHGPAVRRRPRRDACRCAASWPTRPPSTPRRWPAARPSISGSSSTSGPACVALASRRGIRAEEMEYMLFQLDTAEQKIWEMNDATDRSAARLAAGLAQLEKQKERYEDLAGRARRHAQPAGRGAGQDRRALAPPRQRARPPGPRVAGAGDDPRRPRHQRQLRRERSTSPSRSRVDSIVAPVIRHYPDDPDPLARHRPRRRVGAGQPGGAASPDGTAAPTPATSTWARSARRGLEARSFCLPSDDDVDLDDDADAPHAGGRRARGGGGRKVFSIDTEWGELDDDKRSAGRAPRLRARPLEPADRHRGAGGRGLAQRRRTRARIAGASQRPPRPLGQRRQVRRRIGRDRQGAGRQIRVKRRASSARVAAELMGIAGPSRSGMLDAGTNLSWVPRPPRGCAKLRKETRAVQVRVSPRTWGFEVPFLAPEAEGPSHRR